MTISRMQQPRQQYGLGSFVKKIGKKLKKVAKSPIGKLALGIGAAKVGLPFLQKMGIGQKLFGVAGRNPALLGKEGFLSKLGLTKGFGNKGITGKGLAALGIGGASLLAGMGAPKEGEDGLSDSGDRREGLENYLRYYYSNLNPNAKQSEIDDFVKVNMYADGGRVNYAEGSIDYDQVRAIAAPATPPKDLTRPVTKLPGGGGGTIMPVTLPDFSNPGGDGGNITPVIPGRQPGGPTGTPSPGRPIPEQSEGDKLYQDVLDYLKSDSNQIESKEPEAMPMPFDPLKNMLETERDSSLQILKERGFDTDKMKFMEGDYGLLEAVKASGEVDAAKELFEKGFLDKQYSFQDLYGNMDLIDKVKNLYMDKIFAPSYTGYATAGNGLGSGYANDVGITNLPENKEEEERALGGINYESKLKQRLADGGRIGYAEGGRKTFTDYLKNLGMDIEALDIDSLLIMQRAFERDEGEPVMSDREESAYGGRMGFAMGSKPEQNAIKAAGIEGLMLNQNPAGVTELDLRETGGFIPPVGAKEKADDIPAMLANNEFVFTADAVRGMGDGDVNEGAQRMYDMMKTLEKGGRV